MFLAGILMKVDPSGTYKELGFYQSEKGNLEKEKILNKIRDYFIADPDSRTKYAFRSDDYKIVVRKIIKENSPKLLIYCFIMSKSSPSEILYTDIHSEVSMMFDAFESGKGTEIIKLIIDDKIQVLEKTTSVKAIFQDVTKRAAKLVDSDRLDEYQALIKLAQEVPSKIISSIKKADDFLSLGNYKNSEKGYREAADFAASVQENSLSSYLHKRADTVAELPNLQKDIKNNSADVVKIIGGLSKREVNVFDKAYNKVNALISAFDQLEKDDKIEKLQDLVDDLTLAMDLSKKLESYEKSIQKKLNECGL